MSLQAKQCRNHPGVPALSFCHACKESFCGECLIEGQQYYFCRSSACQQQQLVEPAPEPPAVEPLIKEETFLRLMFGRLFGGRMK